MENIYNALIMAGSVLLFLIGVSVAIYNYSVVLEVNDNILTNSENYDRAAERFQYTDEFIDGLNRDDLKRIYSGSQVANMILNMYMVKKELTNPLTGEVIPNPDATTNGLLSRDISYSEINIVGVVGGNLNFKRSTYDFQNMFKKGYDKGKLYSILQHEYYISDATFNGSNSTVTFTKIDDL